MRDLKNNLTSSKSSRNIQSKKTKGFGYQILGFGSGGGAKEYTVNFLVIAGGGAGGGGGGGGGGAGGYRASGYGPSPRQTCSIAAGGVLNVVVGAGGASNTGGPPGATKNPGNDSSFSTISASGGGSGGSPGPNPLGEPITWGDDGGSGGGAGHGQRVPSPPMAKPAGSGNAGSYSPVEGFDGSPNNFPTGSPSFANPGVGGGGGGASETPPLPTPWPGSGPANTTAGRGGIGLPNDISGSAVNYAGGGGGGAGPSGLPGAGSPCGTGGAGACQTGVGVAGTTNRGGGGGGGGHSTAGGAGGSGIVYLRFPGCASVCVSPCTNTVATLPGGCKLATFTVTGTNTVTIA